MIKNIIFDLDNTLIEYRKEYVLYYKEALRNCDYDENNYLTIYNLLDDYAYSLDENNRFYSKKDAIEFLNNKLGTNYNVKLMDEINKVIGKYWTNNVLISEKTLKYLSSKYKLYVFTKWFEDCQAERLKNVGYLKYFVKVFGSDNFGAKPFVDSFKDVLNFISASPEECVMIGDSKTDDILGANNAGIPAILFDYNGKRDRKDVFAPDYKVITDLKELEKIL